MPSEKQNERFEETDEKRSVSDQNGEEQPGEIEAPAEDNSEDADSQ